jgi:hypothetical protein
MKYAASMGQCRIDTLGNQRGVSVLHLIHSNQCQKGLFPEEKPF